MSKITAQDPLEIAFQDAEISRIRHILRKVCKETPEARKTVEGLLVVDESEIPKLHPFPQSSDRNSCANVETGCLVIDLTSDDDLPPAKKVKVDSTNGLNDVKHKEEPNLANATLEGDAGQQNSETTGSEKRSRYAICENCHAEYDVTLNKPDACIRHNGFLEPDEDHSVWDYWDDDKDGNRWEPYEKVAERYPQGYLWSCCDRRGTTKERCLSTPHLDKRSDPALKTSLKKQQEAYLEAKYFP
ncbi:hypothetical protein HDK77DRAFT_472043 [Phyllosticta capitalensis]